MAGAACRDFTHAPESAQLEHLPRPFRCVPLCRSFTPRKCSRARALPRRAIESASCAHFDAPPPPVKPCRPAWAAKSRDYQGTTKRGSPRKKGTANSRLDSFHAKLIVAGPIISMAGARCTCSCKSLIEKWASAKAGAAPPGDRSSCTQPVVCFHAARWRVLAAYKC